MIGFLRCGYNVVVKNFEGPLDLLLELINNYKLDITRISISEVTDQYIFYLKTMQYFNIEIASEFFLIASSLVYIKTKRLLPDFRVDEEEIIDETELIKRLQEYKKFRVMAKKLLKMKEEGDVYFSRLFPLSFPGIKNLEKSCFYVGDLINCLRRYKGTFIKKPIPIKRKEVSVEEKMKLIILLLKKKKLVRWSELELLEKTKIDKVATFLGGIELSFRQKVLLYQMMHFSDIEIKERVPLQ